MVLADPSYIHDDAGKRINLQVDLGQRSPRWKQQRPSEQTFLEPERHAQQSLRL